MGKVRISEAEWPIMLWLWEHGPAEGRVLIDALGPAQDWQPSTVKTLLRRMVEKGALASEAGPRGQVFRPAFSKADSQKQEACSLVDRLFNGSASSLLSAFLEAGDMDPSELASLHTLLEQRLKDHPAENAGD